MRASPLVRISNSGSGKCGRTQRLGQLVIAVNIGRWGEFALHGRLSQFAGGFELSPSGRCS
jgi:hypothetical protein